MAHAKHCFAYVESLRLFGLATIEFLLFALLIISARLAVVCLRQYREGHAIAFFEKNHCLESTKLLSRKSNLVVPITSQKPPSGGSATDSRQSRDSQVLRCRGAGRPWPACHSSFVLLNHFDVEYGLSDAMGTPSGCISGAHAKTCS